MRFAIWAWIGVGMWVGCDAPLAEEGVLLPQDMEASESSHEEDLHVEHACVQKGYIPVSPEKARELGMVKTLRGGMEDPDEEDGSLPLEEGEFDGVNRGRSRDLSREIASGTTMFWKGKTAFFKDQDGDGLLDLIEEAFGTSPTNPDSDGDGWFDGPTNERRVLFLTRVRAHDEQEDAGKDEFYLTIDDARYPQSDLDDYWSLNHGDTKNLNLRVAQRVQGKNLGESLEKVVIKGWEDDFQTTNTWSVDDYLLGFEVDVLAYDHGDTFSVRKTYSDWDYTLSFRVEVETFSDPSPLDASGDVDLDGIEERYEFALSKDFGGLADPERIEIFVELDWMSGHGLKTAAKRLVTTSFSRQGFALRIMRNGVVSTDGCLTRTEAIQLNKDHFSYSDYHAFRYGVMSETLWVNASGVNVSDTFFVDDDTWWIDGGTLAQAGTFIHELGHTMGLVQEVFHLIDQSSWFSYPSSMNYFYQPYQVDFSDSGSGGTSNNHDDWAAVDVAKGLKYSFSKSKKANDGVCD